MATGVWGMKQDDNNNLMKSVVASLVISIPTFCLSFWLIEQPVHWQSPAMIMFIILGLTAGNFAAIVFLEHFRAKLGSLTIPALLGAVGVVLFFIIVHAINRFVRDFGYEWLLPLVVLYLALSVFAIFKERTLTVKFLIGFNAIVLSVLWGLGAADKITLPF